MERALNFAAAGVHDGCGDPRPFVEAMADEFSWHFPGSWSRAIDWGGTREETRRRLLAPLMAQFSEYRVRAQELIALPPGSG